MKLVALIPAHNDDYVLSFCLESIVEHFDEIIVLDDASTDASPDVVLDVAARHPHVRLVRHEGRQLGWIEARNRLAALTDDPRLFWLDSDDVLCEYNAGLLREIAEGERPWVRLQLAEMWGDFDHTTQRLRHYDKCHVYVNRRLAGDMLWRGGSAAHPHAPRAIRTSNGPGPLFFHVKGVKPDWRLGERRCFRTWLRSGREAERAGDLLEGKTEEDIHRMAVSMLLNSSQDKLKRTYGEEADWPNDGRMPPRRPEVIERAVAAGQRFEMVYACGVAIDRIDHGWSGGLHRGEVNGHLTGPSSPG